LIFKAKEGKKEEKFFGFMIGVNLKTVVDHPKDGNH